MTPLEDHQEDTMTDQPRTPTTDDIREGFGLDPSADFYEPAVDPHLPGGPAFDRWLAAHDAEVHKPLADLAFEGALLIEWVRQVVGGLSDPTRAELDDLFDQCSDYSDKWNSGNTTPLDSPTLDRVAAALARASDDDYWVDEISDWEALELGEQDARLEDYPHVAYADREHFRKQARAAVLAIMPKPTDTEETK